MHYSAGVDVLSIVKQHERGRRDPLAVGHEVTEAVYNVEYKWSVDLLYNHPFVNTDIIVAWQVDNLTLGQTRIQDKQDCDAIVESDDAVDGFGVALRNIRHGESTLTSRRNASVEHTVRIVSLRDLVHATFHPWCQVHVHEPVVAQVGGKRHRTRTA